MKTRDWIVGLLTIGATLVGLACQPSGGVIDTILDQVGLIDLVQRTALTPGVDALDSGGVTAVGTDTLSLTT